MARSKVRQNDTVPREIAELQVAAYRYAFQEAVRRANEAIKQRDYFRRCAIEERCEHLSATGKCPSEPCPLAFDLRCDKSQEAEKKARYL